MTTAAQKALDKLNTENAADLTPKAVEGVIIDHAASLVTKEFGTGEVALAHFITRVGVKEFPRGLTFEDFNRLLSASRTYREAIQWTVGDILNESQNNYGDTYAQIADSCGYEVGMMQKVQRMSKSFRWEMRHAELEWSYHETVMSVAPGCRKHLGQPDPACDNDECGPALNVREDWLYQAAEHKWTRDDLRDKMRAARGREKMRGRPRAPGSTRPRKTKAPDEKAIGVLIGEKLEPMLLECVKAAEKFLSRAKEMQANLELKAETNPQEAARVAKRAEEMAETTIAISKNLLKLRDYAMTVANYQPGKREQQRREARASLRRGRKGKVESSPVEASA